MKTLLHFSPILLQVLSECDYIGSLVKNVVEHLNEFGIVSDEDGYGLPSTWIESWSEACTDYLKTHGYEGGPLSDIGEYFQGYGAVYGLFNTTGISYKAAGEYITKLATSKM